MADSGKNPFKNKMSDKVVSIPREVPSGLNIGTLLFGTILIYILITLILYLTSEHITSYEVVEGTISGNYRYSALAMKTEEIETAGESGNIVYYAREGAKVNKGHTICSVGGTVSAGDANSSVHGSVTTNLSDSDLSAAKSDITTFSVDFDEAMFQDVYDFKSDLKGAILQSSINEDAGTYVIGSYYAPASGFVLYSLDGMEELAEEDLNEELFARSAYRKDNLRLKSSVSAGDPIYKLITSDSWVLYFPVTEKLRISLEGLEKVKIRFLKDSSTFSAPFTIIQGSDGYYGKISLTSSLVRYVGDRYLEIELILNRKKGLKIPISAIDEKVFVRVPDEYVTVNQDSGSEVYLLRKTFHEDGSMDTSYVTATVYSHNREKGYYLLNPDLFHFGDYIAMPNTEKQYLIDEESIETIQGVYNINKGYAVFRQVEIVDENEEFCIVNPDNVYGLSAHDRIALDASKVEADDIVA